MADEGLCSSNSAAAVVDTKAKLVVDKSLDRMYGHMPFAARAATMVASAHCTAENKVVFSLFVSDDCDFVGRRANSAYSIVR